MLLASFLCLWRAGAGPVFPDFAVATDRDGVFPEITSMRGTFLPNFP